MEKKELDLNQLSELASNAKDGKLIIEFREGEAAKLLPPVAPLVIKPLNLSGNIGTIAQFLKTRKHLMNDDSCNICVDVNRGEIIFTSNECQENDKHVLTVKSSLKTTKIFEEIEINSGREFEALELSRFLRLRKGLFKDPDQYNKVWLSLSAFKAEVQRRIEKADDRSGNAVHFIKQEVTSNMPKVFTLSLPIFENADKITVDVEIEVSADTLRCTLVSFDYDEKIEALKLALIESELNTEIDTELKVSDFCLTYYK